MKFLEGFSERGAFLEEKFGGISKGIMVRTREGIHGGIIAGVRERMSKIVHQASLEEVTKT